jgi:hypothetical protein
MIVVFQFLRQLLVFTAVKVVIRDAEGAVYCGLVFGGESCRCRSLRFNFLFFSSLGLLPVSNITSPLVAVWKYAGQCGAGLAPGYPYSVHDTHCSSF